ncbi:MAG: hypothetical protein RSP_22270 [Rhodanobacter sp.]
MKTTRIATAFLAASLLAGTAWAQTSSNQAPPPLNLKLPQVNHMPSDLPAAASSTAKPAASASTAQPGSAPGAYYGDTSGRMGNADDGTASAQTCDDSTYNQPQMHGSVGMGVMAGNHMSGNYQSGTVSVSKNLGDCDHPKGGVSFSIGVSQGNFHGRGW